MAARQLPLDLPHRPSLSGEDFLVAPCNAEAVAWVDRWPDWPLTTLVLFGPEAAGKTHLSQVFLARSGGLRLPNRFTANDVPGLTEGARTFALDGVEAFLTAAGEPVLLHLLNWVKESGRQILLTACNPPARWPVVLADLRSRVRAFPAVGIGAPDDALIAAVLAKQFSDRQLRVDGELLSYMLGRMERSFVAARTLVEAIDRLALARRRAITVPLVREVFERWHRGEDLA